MIKYIQTDNHGPVNLREKASQHAMVLSRIPYGTKLDVKYVDNIWSSTVYNNLTGYIMNTFLVDQAPARTIDRQSLIKIYNSLKSTLKVIEEVLQ